MFATKLPLPVVRDAITKILTDAGLDVPTDGMLIMRTYQPSKDSPEGHVTIEISAPGKKPAAE